MWIRKKNCFRFSTSLIKDFAREIWTKTRPPYDFSLKRNTNCLWRRVSPKTWDFTVSLPRILFRFYYFKKSVLRWKMRKSHGCSKQQRFNSQNEIAVDHRGPSQLFKPTCAWRKSGSRHFKQQSSQRRMVFFRTLFLIEN